MKRFLLLLTALLVLALAACGQKSQAPGETAAPATATPAPQPAETEAPDAGASPGNIRAEITPAPATTPGNIEPENPALADSYWVGVRYESRDYGTSEFEAWDEVFSLRLLPGGTGIFRSSFWSVYDSDNGPLAWSEKDGEVTLALENGYILNGVLQDGQLVLEYYTGTLVMGPGGDAPAGEDLGTQLLRGAWRLDSAETEGYAFSAEEEGLRVFLEFGPEGASLYWNSGEKKTSFYEENMQVFPVWQSLYPDCPNGYWYAELSAMEQAGRREFYVTPVGRDRLELLLYTYSDEGIEHPSVTSCFFVPAAEGSVERMTAPEPVTVSTVDELMDAIWDRATVLLAPGTYNVTEWLASSGNGELSAAGYGEYPPYAHGLYLTGFDDEPELMIAGLRGLTLRSADPDHPAAIVCEPRYANVITFAHCSDLRLEGLTVGHTPDRGTCSGAVLHFYNCSSTEIHRCDLYGCGTYGITAEYDWGMNVTDSWIHDCTYGCVYLIDCAGDTFTGVRFTDCAGYTMLDLFGSGVSFYGCDFQRLDGEMLYADEYSSVLFRGCTFDQAASDSLVSSSAYGTDRVVDDRSDDGENARPKG